MVRRKKKLKILIVADPLDHFDPVAETSLFVMREAHRRGHEIFTTTPLEISSLRSQVWGHVHKIEILKSRKNSWYRILSTKRRELKSFDAILLRKDPPFDLGYLHHLYLLEMISSEVYMMNHPTGIMVANEKLLPLPLGKLTPETLVSAHPKDLMDFIQDHPKGTILKPMGEAGGRGIFYLRGPKADNIKVTLEAATQGWSQYVIAQSYLTAARRGDKRILLLGREVLGSFLRRPAPGEHRANLHAGGTAHPAPLTRQDQDLVAILLPLLEKLQLDFVGLDIIGGSLIEINVTSPMGIYEVNQTAKTRCERNFVNFLETKSSD